MRYSTPKTKPNILARMVAFRACLSIGGQQQLQAVLLARCSKFASRIAELEELTEAFFHFFFLSAGLLSY